MVPVAKNPGDIVMTRVRERRKWNGQVLALSIEGGSLENGMAIM